MAETPWHTMHIDAVVENLVTSTDTGLSRTEVENRLNQYGYNQLDEKEGVSPLLLFLGQFNDFIVWVLIAAAIVSGFMGELVDALAIIAIVIINAIIGFIQEFRAEKSLAALQKNVPVGWDKLLPYLKNRKIRANQRPIFQYKRRRSCAGIKKD